MSRSVEGSALSVPKETDLYIADQWPEATEEERSKIFRDTVAAFKFGGKQRPGSFDAALAYFKSLYDDMPVRSGITPLSPDYPPANAHATLKEARIGNSPLAVFYHPTYPPGLGPLMWTFYIGLAGRGAGSDSILLEEERAERGIRLLTPPADDEDEWEDCGLFQVLPATRVRVEYPPDLRRVDGEPASERCMVELVFPEPNLVPVQQLMM